MLKVFEGKGITKALAAGLLAGLNCLPVSAQAWRAWNRHEVLPVSEGVWEVVNRVGLGVQGYWCGIGILPFVSCAARPPNGSIYGRGLVLRYIGLGENLCSFLGLHLPAATPARVCRLALRFKVTI